MIFIVMKRIIFVVAILLILSFTLSARKAQKVNVVCGPYIQCATETSFVVTWVTDIDAVAWVEVAPDDGTHFYNKEREKYYDSRGYGVLPIGRIHKVEINDLKPGTSYRYRIMSKGVTEFKGAGNVKYTEVTGTNVYRGQPYKVSTLKECYDTVRFDMFNDIHSEVAGNDSLFNIVLAGSRSNSDFVFLNGDMLSDLPDYEMIPKKYLNAVARNLNGAMPLFVSRGNHELRGKDALRWFDYYSTPTGAPYYSFSLGKYFFIVLDACEDKPDSDIEYNGIVISRQYMDRQEKWLKEVINSEECRNAEVRIAFCHVAPETKGWYGMAQLCERLVPHLNKAGVDAMFCGHIHRWRVSNPGDGLSNAQFPVICNPKIERMEVTVTDRELVVQTFGTKGSVTNSHKFTLDKNR